MREIRKSGSMRGEGKRGVARRAQATAPLLYSTRLCQNAPERKSRRKQFSYIGSHEIFYAYLVKNFLNLRNSFYELGKFSRFHTACDHSGSLSNDRESPRLTRSGSYASMDSIIHTI